MAAVPLADRADATLLAATGCTDLKRAQKNLELLAGGPLTSEAFLGFLLHLLDALPNSPGPDMALNNLEHLAGAAIPWAFLFSLLAEKRKVLDLLLLRADLDAMADRAGQREREWSALRRFALGLGYGAAGRRGAVPGRFYPPHGPGPGAVRGHRGRRLRRGAAREEADDAGTAGESGA